MRIRSSRAATRSPDQPRSSSHSTAASGVPSSGLPGRSLVPPQAAHHVALFGQVDQLEVEAERVRQRLGLSDVQRVELGGKRALGSLVPGLAEGDRAQPGPLDQLQQRRAALLRDHLAEERAEQLDLTRERVAGTGGADRSRLRARGRIADGHDPLPGHGDGETVMSRGYSGPRARPAKSAAAQTLTHGPHGPTPTRSHRPYAVARGRCTIRRHGDRDPVRAKRPSTRTSLPSEAR